MTDVPTPEIEVLKPPVGSYVAMVFRVDGYDPDVGETPETATMARLMAVDVDGEESGWEVNRMGLYNTTDRVIDHPRDILAAAPSDPGSSPTKESA